MHLAAHQNRNHKRWVLALLATILVLAALVTFRHSPKAAPSAVTMTLLGFTNTPVGFGHFSLFSISNASNYRISLLAGLAEVEGDPQPRARIITTNLPGWTYNPIRLNPGENTLYHFGDPFYPPETGKWRFRISYRRYSVRERWFEFLTRNKLPLKTGPVVLVNPEPIYNPTNQSTVYSQWFTK